MINITKIYLVTNIDNDPNKVYIGKTKNSRYKYHRCTYGPQITYDYIDEVNSLMKKEWEPLESYWIQQFKAWGFTVMNKNKGGGGPEYWTEKQKTDPNRIAKIIKANTGKKHSEEWKQNISRSNMGKKHSLNTIEKIKNTRKVRPVLQYDKQGNFIKEWPSITSACVYLNKPNGMGDITNVCKGYLKSAYKFVWKFKIN